MQWLIDLIRDWVIAQGYLTIGFVDRGDPPVWEFTILDFTTDGTWREFDLSAIVPDGAKAVTLSVIFMANVAAATAYFRKDGNANDANVSALITQLANVVMQFDIVCPISTDRKLEYKFTNVNWLVILVTVKGWWL